MIKTFKEYINEKNREREENKEINYPSGVYIAVKPDEITRKTIRKYQEKYLKQYDINNELHCTLIYSQKPHEGIIEPAEYQATATFESFELFGPDEDILVIKLNSRDLERRNKELVQEYGFISDFDEYKPHITLAYGIKDIDLNSLPPFDYAITLQDEYVEPLDTNWTDSDEDDEGDEDKEGTLVGRALKKAEDEAEKDKK